MRKTVVAAGETAQALARRLGLPLCMVLRANGLFSAAWLLPGREVNVPEKDFCVGSDFPCPARAVCLMATERRLYLRRVDEPRQAAARALGVPLRMIPRHRRAFSVPMTGSQWRLETAGLWTALDKEEQAVNGLGAVIYPGARILKKIQRG